MEDFSAKGFLSASLATQRALAREQFKDEFRECEQWSDRAMASLGALTPGDKQLSTVVAAAYWMRCIRACQGGILLAERGMIPDALTLARSAVESLFHAVAVIDKPELLERLIEHDMLERIKQARGIMSVASIMNHVAPDARVGIEALISAAAEKPRQWAAYDAAKEAGLVELYETMFRGFSRSAAHSTLTALDHEFDQSSVGDLEFGPNYEHLSWTLEMLGICLRVGIERIAGKLE
ncbi:DUF5677 domain-containing protein (plasmid) [Burkholderia vietnamiensis]|uniref:Uncharacterized protein n=1 Tax=Burkholderia vietnamiensis (strain G4 / LMG 22486) TaxID=269482 RepID=A4JVA7_BURVG|nr:hypothetical protein Bcep1808_7333 [Burkholderia vietnamiensis G4]MCB4349397.1 DUF5677 domain-containing protein [Burkholderia vietnamiensis]